MPPSSMSCFMGTPKFLEPFDRLTATLRAGARNWLKARHGPSPLRDHDLFAASDAVEQREQLGLRLFGIDVDGHWRHPQSENGSRTNTVSSRSGLVDSIATGASISSSSRRMYLIAVAGSCAQERAPRVLSCQPSATS
jgi:hypothetical protein